MAPKKKPTIEQRLEAITQTLELVAGMQLSTERQLQHLSKLTTIILTSHEARIKKIEKGGRA